MNHRFIEAEDHVRSNHGKFSVFRFGAEELRYRSEITKGPLLATLPPVRRFGARPLSASTILLLDLQTQEGMLFDPEEGPVAARRRFLLHPLKVCILYFPLVRLLAERPTEIWKLPRLVTLELASVIDQPGVLLDSGGGQVRTMNDWGRRPPLASRLRNREVAPEEDGQDVIDGDQLVPTRTDLLNELARVEREVGIQRREAELGHDLARGYARRHAETVRELWRARWDIAVQHEETLALCRGVRPRWTTDRFWEVFGAAIEPEQEVSVADHPVRLETLRDMHGRPLPELVGRAGEAYLVLVDLAPMASWSHPVAYILFLPTGPLRIEHGWPPDDVRMRPLPRPPALEA